MVKVLLLQAMHGLSDGRCGYPVKDQLDTSKNLAVEPLI
jgi:hypothetical protein